MLTRPFQGGNQSLVRYLSRCPALRNNSQQRCRRRCLGGSARFSWPLHVHQPSRSPSSNLASLSFRLSPVGVHPGVQPRPPAIIVAVRAQGDEVESRPREPPPPPSPAVQVKSSRSVFGTKAKGTACGRGLCPPRELLGRVGSDARHLRRHGRQGDLLRACQLRLLRGCGPLGFSRLL